MAKPTRCLAITHVVELELTDTNKYVRHNSIDYQFVKNDVFKMLINKFVDNT